MNIIKKYMLGMILRPIVMIGVVPESVLKA
jgi:hypothetical protein